MNNPTGNFTVPSDDGETPSTTTALEGNPPPTNADVMAAMLRALQAAYAPKTERIKVQTFDGSDYSLYPQFESILRAKFELEPMSFPSEAAKIWWALGRLKGKAARVMNPWTEVYKTNQAAFSMENMFEQMKVQFGDTERQKKALQQLQHLRQGNQPFEDLLANFDRLLMEAGGFGWDDRLKIGLLRDALNYGMKDRMVSVVEEGTYVRYCQQVKGIADKLEELQKIKRSVRRVYGGQSPPRTNAPTPAPNPQPPADTMDWEPTHARMDATKRRAKWASPEDIEHRRKKHLCFRCGGSGHIKPECPYLPARNPNLQPRIRPVARVAFVAPELEDEDPKDEGPKEDDEASSDESGKE